MTPNSEFEKLCAEMGIHKWHNSHYLRRDGINNIGEKFGYEVVYDDLLEFFNRAVEIGALSSMGNLLSSGFLLEQQERTLKAYMEGWKMKDSILKKSASSAPEGDQ